MPNFAEAMHPSMGGRAQVFTSDEVYRLGDRDPRHIEIWKAVAAHKYGTVPGADGLTQCAADITVNDMNDTFGEGWVVPRGES